MSWSTLSEDLWKRILDYVPLKDRLSSCSQVSRTLCRAAAAATCVVTADDVHSVPAMCQWMALHGQHLTSLQLSAVDEDLTQLPCPNLRELDLTSMDVQLGSSSTQPGVLHSCTLLTLLRLDSCYFTSTDEYGSSLAALSALMKLQHLELVDNKDGDGWKPSAVLQRMPLLTFLRVRDQDNSMLVTGILQHLSCLTNLQELHIFGSFRLQHQRVSLSPSATPGLSRLTALRQITLQRVSLDPAMLQDCMQLQALKLLWVQIICAGDAAALHSLLGRLQQLQSLQLHELEYDWPVAAAAYSILTASSVLQQLHLTVDDLPAGVWPHVFPPDRQLPALRELSMRWHGFLADEPGPPPAAMPGTEDLSCISACCPGLCRLNVFVQPGTDLGELASGLTSLSVSGLHEESFESLRALSGLVSLRELTVYLGGPITPQDLLCLTALKGLTFLFVDPLLPFDGEYDVALNLAQGRCLGGHLDTPVWLQVLQHCGRFSECQPLIFNSVIQQLLEQQERHTLQEQQLAAQQQQFAELQEQLAITRAQAAAEAAAAAAQVRERLQALEVQVQQLLQAMQRQGV